jgi:hypothetical protein
MLAGCMPSATAADVEHVAARFARAAQASDGATLCRLLAPATREEIEESAGAACPAAITDEPLGTSTADRKTSVFGDEAMVTTDDDTLFLSRFADGWRVAAAACKPRAGRPYDCRVKGA